MKNKKIIFIILAIFIVAVIIGIVVTINVINKKDKNNNDLSNSSINQTNENSTANNIDNANASTGDFSISGVMNNNGNCQYSVNLDENTPIYINASEFNLPSNLYDYKDNIKLRLTYSNDDNKIYDCKIINSMTSEIVEDTSDDNMKKLFDITYGKETIEETWTDTIKLSSMKEDTIIKFTANKNTNIPVIENDTGKDCIIYTKTGDSESYEGEIRTSVTLSSNSLSYNQINSGDSYYLIYKFIENSQIINLVDENDVVYLSKETKGNAIDFGFKKYLYNDTNEQITLLIEEDSNTMQLILNSKEICAFDWQIDYIAIQ